MIHFLLAIIVSATIDSTTIAIGDQTDMKLQATYAPGERVALPIYGETLIQGIEVVDRTVIDTTQLQSGQTQITQYLTLTSFKDSLFYIEPIPFVSGEDTFWSEPLSLNVVQPFRIDTADKAITDIKDIQKAPIWWWGILRWILLGIGVAGIGIGLYFLIRYLKRKQNGEMTAEASEPLRPAEEVALEKLEKIRLEKIWQNGKVKEYHTELTDVVREYIARRFDVRSGEKTSDETLRAMKQILKDQRALFDSLHRMLQLADLVKFAKWTTTPSENENCLQSAYDFVQQTTPVNEEPQEHNKNERL
ncbi:MAG: hypothetical protein MJZ88_03550 [Paludibacteraceae bacterium]|nr:hypothetical protein [Paludibacteraceae bacterium]